MTEETVQAVFFKNYSDRDLNETLMASIEEITLAIIKEGTEEPESLPDIIKTIAMGKSHINLFARITDGTNPSVPMSYLVYFDQVRKAMMDIVKYMRDNFEVVDPWFRKQCAKEDLNSILNSVALLIEKSAGTPENIRSFHSDELKLYYEFFNTALVGIIGIERFNKYAKEYNKCAIILRQCQVECQAFNVGSMTKES